jgi:hypothetical protein
MLWVLLSLSSRLTAFSPETVTIPTQPNTVMERQFDNIDDLAISPSSSTSPAKDSPSRRKRLLGSLRTMGSLRSLRSAHGNTKSNDNSPVKAESKGTPIKRMPSLMLNFEVSPADKPMFETNAQKAFDSPSMEGRRSSPIAVPMTIQLPANVPNTPPGTSAFVVGTVPDSPAPLMCASVQKAILTASSTTDMEPMKISLPERGFVQANPDPTPMPGTNLSLEDVAPPAIVVQSPSVPSMYCKGMISSFGNAPAREYNQKDSDSVVNSDPLSVDKPDFDEIFAMTTPKASDSVLDSCQGFPRRNSSLRASYDSNDLGSNLAYIVWGPSDVDENRAPRERPSSIWSRDTTVHNGGESASKTSRENSSDNTGSETTWTEFTEPDQALSLIAEKLGSIKISDKQERCSSVDDDDEELQNMLRSYTGSMLYRNDVNDEQITELSSLLGDEVSPDVRADISLSIRIMNRSLGG